jgi:hypothetical protein
MSSRRRSTPKSLVVVSQSAYRDLLVAFDAEIAAAATRAGDHAEVLGAIGAQAFEVAGLLGHHSSASELLRNAHQLRGLMIHALAVLAELQCDAELAVLRRAADDANQD